MRKDVFDLIMPDEPDDFERVESEDSALERIKTEMSALLQRVDSREQKELNKKLTDQMMAMVREEISKIKPVQKVIERTIEKKVIEPVHIEPKVIEAPPTPPQIIREVRVEVQKDSKVYADVSSIKSLHEKIDALTKELDKVRESAEHPIFVPSRPGGPGVIGIPAPEGNEGKFLKVTNNKATWGTGGGGTSISGYTINDGTTLKDLPADASLDDLRQVLGTLITELQS